MPFVHVTDHALAQLKDLPPELREAAQARILGLLLDPEPPGAEPYAQIPDAYRYTAGLIVVFYRRSGPDIDILVVRPNS